MAGVRSDGLWRQARILEARRVLEGGYPRLGSHGSKALTLPANGLLSELLAWRKVIIVKETGNGRMPWLAFRLATEAKRNACR